MWTRARARRVGDTNAKPAGGDQLIVRSFEGGEAGDIAERPYSDVVMRILEAAHAQPLFQPIVNLLNGSAMGYEALARPEGSAPLDSVEAVFEAAAVIGDTPLCRWRLDRSHPSVGLGVAAPAAAKDNEERNGRHRHEESTHTGHAAEAPFRGSRGHVGSPGRAPTRR